MEKSKEEIAEILDYIREELTDINDVAKNFTQLSMAQAKVQRVQAIENELEQLNPARRTNGQAQMVTVLEPREKGQRITYHVPELPETFTSVTPPINEGYGIPSEKGNRNFFLNYRKNVLSKYMAPMYKWGENYDLYSLHPKIIPSHRKQRWEEMYSKPNVQLTFKDQSKIKEIDDFYLLCQFQRQYYNDYTGHLHPMDYFQRNEYKWASPPDFNSMYVQFPEMYVKYKQPVVLPLTTDRAWIEPLEPSRRLAGKYDPYPDLKFPR